MRGSLGLPFLLAACTVADPHYVNVDGRPADGAIDASADAPVACSLSIGNGAAADLVLGQTDFTSNAGNDPFEGASSLKTVKHVFSDGTRLWASDRGNYRVLQWNDLPIVNGQAANLAVGQASMISHVTGMQSRTILDGGGPSFVVGNRLLISDTTEHRVLIWNSIPTTNAEPADLVLGQTSFVANASGNGASNFYGPSGIWSDGTRLVITDLFNSRVLIWNTFPTTNGQAADLLLGWPNFGIGGPTVTPPTASSLANPRDVTFDGTRLYVADSLNNRVLIWNQFPTVSGQAADVVVGQSSFANGGANGGSPAPNAVGLDNPNGVAIGCGGALFIADFVNDRVVIHDSLPSTNGVPADTVLGKPDFTTPASAILPPSATNMTDSDGVTVTGKHLFATDQNRVLRFTLSN